MAGIAVNKDQVNSLAGQLALEVKDVLDRVLVFQEWLAAKTTADLVALGFQDADVAIIKSGIADAAQLAEIFYGREALADAKDFRAFLKQLYGIGRR